MFTKSVLDIQSWLQDKTILILSYTINFRGKTSHYLSGPSQDLLVYMKERAGSVVFFEQPDAVSEDLTPRAKIFSGGNLAREFTFPMFWFPLKKGRREIAGNPVLYFFFKLRDFLSTVYFCLRVRRRFDVVVAVEAPNMLQALMMRALRLARVVIYDNIDYSPQRFQKRWLNALFHWLDRLCVKRADYVWNQTGRVAEERAKRGIPAEKAAPQLVKPTGVLAGKIRQRPAAEIQRRQIVYMGSFLRRDGVEVLIEAFEKVARSVLDAKLVLIGEGEFKAPLEEKIRKMGLESKCHFLGIVEDEERLEEILLESAIGVAPYSDEPGTVKLFNDVSKPKVYLSCGLPVVITRVPLVADEINRRGAGMAVPYNSEAMAHAFQRLLTDDDLFEKARRNAIEMARDYSWNKIFDRLFQTVMENFQ